MELLIHLPVWLLHRAERLFRTSLERAVPDLAELEANPADYLASRGEVVVGPRWWLLVTAVIGFPLGSLAGLFMWIALQIALNLAGLMRPELVDPLLSGCLIGGAIVGWPVAVWLSRGGRMHLRPDGVVFSYRRKDVFCPWVVIKQSGRIEHIDEKWSRLPVWPGRADGVTLTIGGWFVAAGASVTATHAGFDQPGLVARVLGREPEPPDALNIRDLYAVRREQLLPLLLRVASAAGPGAGRPVDRPPIRFTRS